MSAQSPPRNHPTALRGLVRKEIRQLIPLALLLFAIAIALMVLRNFMTANSSDLKNFGRYVPLTIPALFACGVAAILVSQEREQKTLRWLITMPIEPAMLFRVKLGVAAGCLAVIWIACWILIRIEVAFGLFPGGFQFPFQQGLSETFLFDLFMWHLHSLYVLVCGFYASWRIKNSLLSLIAIVPLAFAPFLLIQLGYYLRRLVSGARFVDTTASGAITLSMTVCFCIALTWLARRAALRELSPAEPPQVDSNLRESRRGSLLAFFRPPTLSSRPVPTTPYSSSVVSLYWQSLHHNRIALAVIVTMIVLGALSQVVPMTRPVSRYLQLWMKAGGYLGCCWLGVLAFVGDGNAKHLRFFSDRGISPAKLWLGRHLLGMMVLSSVALLYLAVSIAFQSIELDDRYRSHSILLLPLAIAIFCYFISQWVSHVMQTLPAAIIVAPIAVGCAMALPASVVPMQGLLQIHVAAIVSLGVLWVLFPMLSTFLTMRLFADGNRNKRFYVITGCMVSLWIFITLIPAGLAYKAFPRLSSQQRRSLAVQASKAKSTVQRPPRQVMAFMHQSPLDSTAELTPEEVGAVYRDQDQRPETLLPIPTLTEDSPGVFIDQFRFKRLYAIANLDLLRFKASPDDTTTGDRIQSWVTTMTRLAMQLRKSPRLLDQASADITESWLIRTLSCDAYQSQINSDSSLSAIALVTDQMGRAKARRRAVLVSWAYFDENREEEEPNNQFGGYDQAAWSGNLHSPIEIFLFRDQIVDSIAFHSLAIIDAELAGQSSEQPRRALHRVTRGFDVAFDLGAYSPRNRRSGASQAILARGHYHPQFLIGQWFAAWETDALILLEKQTD